jgi:predicted membrane chloride channel (bestrophin family)
MYLENKMSLLLWYPTPYYLKFFIIISLISTWNSIAIIIGTIISLLLAFKSNQAYDRWWKLELFGIYCKWI